MAEILSAQSHSKWNKYLVPTSIRYSSHGNDEQNLATRGRILRHFIDAIVGKSRTSFKAQRISQPEACFAQEGFRDGR